MPYYIYKIVCNDVSITEFYVGSTTCIRKRKYCHKCDCNNPNSKSYNVKIYQTIRENGGWDNWRMVIIEEMIDATNIQAHIREEHYRLELGATLNTYCCGTGLIEKEYQKEYRQTNKDTINEYNKIYKETNKEQLKEYNKEWYETNKDIIKEKRKQYQREYQRTEKNKEYRRQYNKEYYKKQKELKELINI